jgi:hypothetical protein
MTKKEHDARVDRPSDSSDSPTAATNEAAPTPAHTPPSVAECLDEIRRLRVQNERLRERVAEAHPNSGQLIEIATALRDVAFDFEMKAGRFAELRDAAYALVGPNALPRTEELAGICSSGKDRVDAAADTACAHGSPACEACSSRFEFRMRRAVRKLREQAEGTK